MPNTERADGRKPEELRPVTFVANFAPHATGSVLVRYGSTQVICAATIEPGVPNWMKQQGVKGGWLTAEYSMLPYSTHERKARDINKGRLDGRTVEIQRLIGRSLRATIDLDKLGQNTLWLDCDVLQADGGTRTASITGAYVAARLAVQRLLDEGKPKESSLIDSVAAVSVAFSDTAPARPCVCRGQGGGAGKTTTIAMIMGLVLPTSGRTVLGRAMPERSAEVLGRMNFESPYVDMPMRLTVRQNLTIFGQLYAVENLAERIEQLAAELDLGDFLDRANGKLSAGQKTRVALAKALINQPELLLLDEPTASLDPDTADWVRQHLLTYRSRHGATILLASHNMLEVERLCDRVIIMKRGRVEDDDSPDKIMARYNRATLEEVFLDVARGRVQEAAS